MNFNSRSPEESDFSKFILKYLLQDFNSRSPEESDFNKLSK